MSTSASSTARGAGGRADRRGLPRARGRRRARSAEGGPATEPLTVALLVDDSQAIDARHPDDPRGGGRLHHGAPGKAEIAIVTFGERPTIAVDYTTDQKKLHDGAKRIFPRAGRRRLPDRRHRRGQPRHAEARAEAAGHRRADDRQRDRVQQPALRAGARASSTRAGAALHVVALGQPSASDDRRDAQPRPGDRATAPSAPADGATTCSRSRRPRRR